MPYIAKDFEAKLGSVVGDGECVTYVVRVSHAPAVGAWHAGIQVKGSAPGAIEKGTVIATMVDGHYPGEGRHAAIYLSHDSTGIQVIDQWVGQKVHYRTIYWHHQGYARQNDGDAYYVVE